MRSKKQEFNNADHCSTCDESPSGDPLQPFVACAGSDDSGGLWLTSSLRLPQVFAAAHLETLQQSLSRQGPSETPFLLQAFVTAPNLVEGDPNPRLLGLAKLLVQGAKLNGSAKAAAVASQVIQDVMLVSVCREFHTDEGNGRQTGSCLHCCAMHDSRQGQQVYHCPEHANIASLPCACLVSTVIANVSTYATILRLPLAFGPDHTGSCRVHHAASLTFLHLQALQQTNTHCRKLPLVMSYISYMCQSVLGPSHHVFRYCRSSSRGAVRDAGMLASHCR